RLVDESGRLFRDRPYRSYRFLLTLSDAVREYGLEHRASSDVRLPARVFSDAESAASEVDVLAHELVHAWNGKLRRPRGLATADFQQPQVTDLLWVYEGLTDYLDYV